MSIFQAVNNEDIEEISKLLEQGVDINIVDKSRDTPLLLACYLSFVDIAFYLLEYNPNIHAKDHRGRTALMYVSGWGHTELIKKLVEKGAEIDNVDYRGCSALYFAIYHNQIDAIKLLYSLGASLLSIIEKKYIFDRCSVETYELLKILIGTQVRSLRHMCIAQIYQKQISHSLAPALFQIKK